MDILEAKKIVVEAGKQLVKTGLIARTWGNVSCRIDENTFVYFDPPYRPLNRTSSFTAYTENDFDDNMQRALAEFAEEMSAKGAKVVLSNSDPKNADPEDNFFDDLYDGFRIKRVKANRMINSNSEARGKITELLISNF